MKSLLVLLVAIQARTSCRDVPCESCECTNHCSSCATCVILAVDIGCDTRREIGLVVRVNQAFSETCYFRSIRATLTSFVQRSSQAGPVKWGVILFGSRDETLIPLTLNDKVNRNKKMAQIEVLNILATFNPMDHGNGTFALEKAVEMFYSSNCYESNVILVTNGGNIAYHKIDGIDIKIVTINKYECHENNPEECWQFRNRLPYFYSELYKNFFLSSYLQSLPKLHLQSPGHMSFLQDHILYKISNCQSLCKEWLIFYFGCKNMNLSCP